MGTPPYSLIIAGIILGLALLAVIFSVIFGEAGIGSMQEQGLWPQPGQTPTMDDVQRLVNAGHKIPAIKMYRMIKRVGLKEAKDAVEALAAGK